jgi:hypothetical protein
MIARRAAVRQGTPTIPQIPKRIEEEYVTGRLCTSHFWPFLAHHRRAPVVSDTSP